MTEKNCFKSRHRVRDELHIILSNAALRMKQGRPVSSYEVARRGDMVVRACENRVSLHVGDECVRVWHDYARAGYTALQAAEELFNEGEKHLERNKI